MLEHIRSQGYFIVRNASPTPQTRMAHPKVARVVAERGATTPPARRWTCPISQLVLRTAEAARGPIVKLPTWAAACRCT